MQARTVLADLPEQERIAFWRDVVCTHVYRITAQDWNDPATGDGHWEVRDCAPFGLAEVQSPFRTRARGPRDIASDGVDAITVQRVLGEPMEFDFGNERYTLDPGDLCILAMDWRHEVRARRSVGLRSLEIPRAVLSPLMAAGSLRRPLVLRSYTPLGAMVSSGLDAAWAQVPRMDPATGNAVLRNLAGLVALAYGASDEGRNAAGQSLQARRLEAAKAYVLQHLSDPDLDPARVAEAQGISLRTLHKLFETQSESLAQFIMRQRLSTCRVLLECPAGERRSVADIAYGAGFNSLPTFYRAFTAAFGMPPGEVRQGARAAA